MRIVLFLVIILLFLIIFSNRSISKVNKTVFSVLLILVFVMGYMYENYVESAQSQNMLKVEAFKQGKLLKCKDGILVDNRHFSYFSGTETFAAKPDSKYVDVIISIDECKVSKK